MNELLQENATQTDIIRAINQLAVRISSIESQVKRINYDRALIFGFAGHELKRQIEDSERFLEYENKKIMRNYEDYEAKLRQYIQKEGRP